MTPLNLKAIDPAELLPIPDIPESYGPRNEEDQRVYDLVMAGLNSRPAIPVDGAFFRQLDAIILTEQY